MISATEFKQALQSWASGVTIVTTHSEQHGLQGMTVSAFSSVSADPALILCCVNGTADTIAGIDASQCFAVNVLAATQQNASSQFAGGCSYEERFTNNPWHTAVTGSPLLSESLMSLDCKLIEKVQAGSHWILIGEVQACESRDGEPLLYYRAGYHELAIHDDT
ncbi:MAG: flavin reductase family protein [Methylococcales bacterium]|nr:flavin reductase family protein [Methylococcales bacterium]MDD5753830.1 flavin reductase family protein [Methylococcales bacterium]